MKSVYITFKYNTDKEKINVEILLKSFTELLEEICKQLFKELDIYCDYKKLDIRIENVKKGSIEVNFVINITANIEIIHIFLGLILVKMFFKGNKPKKEVKEKIERGSFIDKLRNFFEKYKVRINEDLIKSVIKLARKKEIDEKIIEMVKYIKEEYKDIRGFEIIVYEDKERKEVKYKIEINRGELEFLVKPNPLLEEENQEIDPNEGRDWGMGPGR